MDEQGPQTPQVIKASKNNIGAPLGISSKGWQIIGGVLVLSAIGAGLLLYNNNHPLIRPLQQNSGSQNSSTLYSPDGFNGTVPPANSPQSDYPLQGQYPINPNTQPSSSPAQSGSNNEILTTFDLSKCSNPLPPVTGRSGMAEWVQPVKLKNLRLFQGGGEGSYIQDDSYVVGRITSGKYTGGDVLLTIVSFEGMGTAEVYDRIIRLNGKYYFLLKYSQDFAGQSQWDVLRPIVNMVVDRDFDLADLDFPENLHSESPAADFSITSSLGFFKNNSSPFCADYLSKAFTDPGVGDVYMDTLTDGVSDTETSRFYYPLQAFYVKSPDSSMQVYALNVPIVGEDNVPFITWNGGQKNKLEYSYKAVGGCGASKFLDVVKVSPPGLTVIGSGFDGKVVYGYISSQEQEMKDMYNNIYLPDGQTKPSYSAFIAEHPIFFWQDPFGRYVRFKLTKYMPVAECAKPVIYLYPTQTEKISVELNPLGGWLKSEPAYNSGWNVIADTQSNITNLADGQTYPYLFWEGRGGMYQTPDKGFVVKQADVHGFLTDKLHRLGLNDKESKDFMEFWEPKMQGAPYYFVTFMGNNVMDELAPLSITPKPDTVIRILMDFKPLNKPITAQGYSIHTPERKGFTVIEWGGVLSAANN